MSEGGDVCTAGGDWTKKLIVMRQFLDPAVSEASLLLFGGSKEKSALSYRVQKSVGSAWKNAGSHRP